MPYYIAIWAVKFLREGCKIRYVDFCPKINILLQVLTIALFGKAVEGLGTI